MCGRYILINGRKVFATFELLKELERKNIPYMDIPRYNASPMQKMPIVVKRNKEIQPMEAIWWLIPHWSKTGKPEPAFKSFNARAEGIATSKLFGPYFRARRCLIPADGFYEWKRSIAETEVKGKLKKVEIKIPMCIRMKDLRSFYFGGVFSIWKDAEQKEHPNFTIITTTPNELMEQIHNRMPVIVHEENFEEWLEPDNNDVDALQQLLVPYPTHLMTAYPVSTLVNNSANNEPACIEPV
jgi:putative SOS response-associated peptidase YedK